jgi:hypothetical protein
MKTRSRLAVNGDGSVFDSTTGERFQGSPVALVILRGLMEEQSDAQIVEQLALDYDMTIESALRDVNDFRGQLKASGIL